MRIEDAIRGSLFARDFICESIAETEEWTSVNDETLVALKDSLVSIFEAFPADSSPNESQTEDDLIWPVLTQLGWTASLRQQNLSASGRADVPDGLLFADDKAKRRANRLSDEWRRYELGLVLVESKRWLRPLDRGSGRVGEATAPSTQMLRYLRRADDLTSGSLRWGILTNGARWRLYYQGAQSVSEQFFEFDFREVLGLSQAGGPVTALSEVDGRHCLRLVALALRPGAFLRTASDPRSFHQRAIDEGRFYEQRIAADLTNLVFGKVFPELARAIAAQAPQATLDEVRDATLILLYRLLFILYAEDRNLLPVKDHRYEVYALRENVRGDVGHRMDTGDTFSDVAARYWLFIDDLCRTIGDGDPSIGLPPYNGGLFDRKRAPLLDAIRISDSVMAIVIDALSFEQTSKGRRYINYRDLSVQQLGSVYERLVEREIVRGSTEITVRPNVFARRDIGSYYTPDDLVGLIIKETVGPLVDSRLDAFSSAVAEKASKVRSGEPLSGLESFDPAERILDLRVCDPAMGSGHFLVRLVDYLADRVIAAMGESESAVAGYVSPLAKRIRAIRDTIAANAEECGWAIDTSRLDDRHIIRRMVLKRCVYGVDKNPMAVELAKVSLWLHTFTVGAPLSFLDHHIRCGDSLFGCWVHKGVERAKQRGGELFLAKPLERALRAERDMQTIERLTDAEIAEAHRSAEIFAQVEERTSPLASFLTLVHAFDWLRVRSRADKAALSAYFSGAFGDPIDIATGRVALDPANPEIVHFSRLLGRAEQLAEQEGFLHWQAAFPGVWTDWESDELHGGFSAVIGNPPWDRMKLQQVEWFSLRRPEIAMALRAADRKRMISELKASGDPLAHDFKLASQRAKDGTRVAREGGEYPLLGRGDINLYALFVERAMSLVKSDGLVGLLTPSGIASDKTASLFFKSVATEGRLRALYDFENGRRGPDTPPFFPDVDTRFKFCAFVASKERPRLAFGGVPGQEQVVPAQCGFFLHNVEEIDDPERCFRLEARDFESVNPNTGTAPIFRSRRAAVLTRKIYGHLPVMVNRSGAEPVKAWPVNYQGMLHMTNDSGLFRRRQELEESEGAWPIGNNRYDSPKGIWGASLRREDGSGVRPPCCQRQNQSREPAQAGPAYRGHAESTPRPQLAARSPVLGPVVQTGVHSLVLACVQRRDSSYQLALDDRGDTSSVRRGEHLANCLEGLALS